MATKKVAKKAGLLKPAKVAKSTQETRRAFSRTIPLTKPEATLISFSVTAVIPTQQYGNIQPKIEVTASSIEEARAFVMPVIEDLYKQYAESKPGFLGKVVVTEKIIPQAQVSPVPAEQAQNSYVENGAAQQPQAQSSAAQQNNTDLVPGAAPKPKSDAVLKAEKAISLAMTAQAAIAIQDQIEKSVKIAPEDKPELIALVLKKRNEFK